MSTKYGKGHCRQVRIFIISLIPIYWDRAGATDSLITNHGMLQIERLAKYIASGEVCDPTRITQVYTSGLRRARMTARGTCTAISSDLDEMLRKTCTEKLRERDYGKMEGLESTGEDELDPARRGSEPFPEWAGCESDSSMRRRAVAFFNQHIRPLLDVELDDCADGNGFDYAHNFDEEYAGLYERSIPC